MLKNSSTFSQKEAGEDLGFMVHEYISPCSWMLLSLCCNIWVAPGRWRLGKKLGLKYMLRTLQMYCTIFVMPTDEPDQTTADDAKAATETLFISALTSKGPAASHSFIGTVESRAWCEDLVIEFVLVWLACKCLTKSNN
jgi:hypothetical protein